MNNHNNINLGPLLEELTERIKAAADNDTLIAVQEERDAIVNLALERGYHDLVEVIRERGD